jgi:hypothetical protein
MAKKRLNTRGHGGPRANQHGRPKKPKEPPPPVVMEAGDETPEQAFALARRFSTVAVEVLVQIATKADAERSGRCGEQNHRDRPGRVCR